MNHFIRGLLNSGLDMQVKFTLRYKTYNENVSGTANKNDTRNIEYAIHLQPQHMLHIRETIGFFYQIN